MKTTAFILLQALLVLPAAAQTQLVRGAVDNVQGTPNFQLECTTIPVIASNPLISLPALELVTHQNDMMLVMQVINVGTSVSPILDIQSAVVVPALFDMGNLEIGESESWEVSGTPGSPAAVFITLTLNTIYLPIGAAGTWLLDLTAIQLASGTIGGGGQFQFQFTMPNIPSLIGVSLTAQAGVAEPIGLVLTNPDCKQVESGS